MCRTLRLLGLVLAWAIVLAPTTLLATLSQEPSPALQAGIELLQSDQPWEALQKFGEAKLADPQDDRPYYYAGVALLKLERLREAAAELAEASKLRPNSAPTRLLQAEVLFRLGHVSRAIEAISPYQRGEGLEDLEPPNLWLLADLFYRLDRLDDAQLALEALRVHQPENPQLLLRLGAVELASSRFDEAEEVFRSVLKVSPDSSEAHYGIGLAAWRRRDLTSARQHLEAAHQNAPEDPRYAYQLGVVLLDLGEYPAALEMMQRAEPAAGQFPEIYSHLARIHRRLGDMELSRQYLDRFEANRRRAQESRDESRQAERLLAQATAELQSGRIAEARGLLDQVLAVDPQNGTAHAYLAKIYLSSRRWRDARTHLQALESIRGDDFEVHYLWADFHFQQNRPVDALPRAAAAVRLRPADAELHNLLGNIYLALGRDQEAVSAYEKAVELDPERPEYQINLDAARRRVQPQR